jgi:drug/metabolite transporter (DMT)-like permease
MPASSPPPNPSPAPTATYTPGPASGGLAAGLAAVIMWGLAPVATRALVGQLAPLPLLVLRIGLSGLVLLPWCVRHRRRLERGHLGRLVLAGLLCMVGYNLPVTVGLQWVPASTAALILATEPVWILALGRIFLGTPVPPLCWAGAAVALGGIAVLAGPEAITAAASGRALAGTGLVLLGTALFGAYTLVLRPLATALGGGTAAAFSTVAGSVPYLALAALIPAGAPLAAPLARLPAAAWAELGFLALGCTVAGLAAWSIAVARAGSGRAGLLLYLEPLVGVTGAVTFLGEQVSAAMAAGGAMIMAGVAAAWLAQHPRPRPRPTAADPVPDAPAPRRAGPAVPPDPRSAAAPSSPT